MVDHAAKCVAVCPTKGGAAAGAAEALAHRTITMGAMPKRIFTGQGGFTGMHQVWAALLQRPGIAKRHAVDKGPAGGSHSGPQAKNISRMAPPKAPSDGASPLFSLYSIALLTTLFLS